MSVIGTPLLLGADDGGYQISRSVRLRSSASAYFNRTPASAGNRKTWTWSGWVKRGALPASGYYSIFGADSGSGQSFYVSFDNSTQQLEIGQGATVNRKTTQVFRDPSAWYHLVVQSDTTQATAANRLRVYINGVQITAFATSNDPSLNGDWALNNNVAHAIGADITNTGARNYFDCYLTEVNFIDGQALTPSSFGETDTITGVWKPKKYAGTYGTNGFYLNFSDPSAATAAAIGKDYSGNGNNWTPNNISVTAGVTYDSMLDVPTPYADGGNGRGNYCVLNPLDKGSTVTLSSGNLNVSITSGLVSSRATIGVASGKWYWEATCTTVSSVASDLIGIGTSAAPVSDYFHISASGYGYAQSTGNKWNNNASSAYGASWTTGDVIGVALDLDAGTLVFYKNGTSQGTAFSGLSGTFFPMMFVRDSVGVYSFNFGQRPFAYTPPTGFRALNTQNLPESTIRRGTQWFDATTYTGNGTTLNVNNAAGFAPDLVWIKSRSGVASHGLHDRVRGEPYAVLFSDSTASESTGSSYVSSSGGLTSTGFQVNNNSAGNGSGATLVGWQWKRGATAGFDIVTYTGNGVDGRTVAHSLGVKPDMVIIKKRANNSATNTGNWIVQHKSLTAGVNANSSTFTLTSYTNGALYLNLTSGQSSYGFDNQVNGNTDTFVAYLFAEVAGFSRFGSYTGNGSTDGPFVFCGFRPRYILVKNTVDNTTAWSIFDTARSPFNIGDQRLEAQSSAAESSLATFDILSNGFKLRTTNANNTSGQTMIFAAFAENPFKNSLAR